MVLLSFAVVVTLFTVHFNLPTAVSHRGDAIQNQTNSSNDQVIASNSSVHIHKTKDNREFFI